MAAVINGDTSILNVPFVNELRGVTVYARRQER